MRTGTLLWVVAFIILLCLLLLCAAGRRGATGGARPFSLGVRMPWFDKIRTGEKTVEGRLNRPPYSELRPGEAIEVRRSRAPDDKTEYGEPRRFAATVTSVDRYGTFAELLKEQGLERVLPGVKTAAAGEKVYREFYQPEAEKEHGVLAIGLKADSGAEPSRRPRAKAEPAEPSV